MKALMVVSTTRQAGKSLLTMALCRSLARRGLQVTPFQPEYIESRIYRTSMGYPIGFPVALQAWAARALPQVCMNPILLIPQDQDYVTIAYEGRQVGRGKAADYYGLYKETSDEILEQAWQQLAGEFQAAVIEGTGEIAHELIPERSLVNLGLAVQWQARAILVVDASRGGFWGQWRGSLALLSAAERNCLAGVVINRYDGDLQGLYAQLNQTPLPYKIPLLGILPTYDFQDKAAPGCSFLAPLPLENQRLRCLVLDLPHLACFNDLDPLIAENSVDLHFWGLNEDFGHPDAIILPASRQWGQDLALLRENPCRRFLLDYVAAGGVVFALGNGVDMLAQQVTIQTNQGTTIHRGLGLLPVDVVHEGPTIKRPRQVMTCYPQEYGMVAGYEYTGHRVIPVGQRLQEEFHSLFEEPSLGWVNHQHNLWTSYLHDVWDHGPWRRTWLNILRQRRGFSSLPTGIADYSDRREWHLNHWADQVEQRLDFAALLGSLSASG